MPYINSASIQSGQIIQANHVLNVINTFNDTATTDIKMKGTASFNEVNIANLRVTGTASIDVFVTTYYSSSIIYASGSTKFGDSADDTHQYTGSLGVNGALRVDQGITGSLLGTSSFATTASFAATASFVATASFAATASYALNAGVFTGSFATTGSNRFVGNQTVTGSITATGRINGDVFGDLSGTASYAFNLVNGIFTGSYATTGSNVFRGNQTVSGSVNITGSLTVSGSSTFTNIGPTILRGTLAIIGEDGGTFLSASRTVSSSLSSSIEPTTAEILGSGSLTKAKVGTTYTWNSDFQFFYSGVSGSGETEVGGKYDAFKDNSTYNSFKFVYDTGITLSPSGSIGSYNLYVLNVDSGNWFVTRSLTLADLLSGPRIDLTGPTNTNFETDLISKGFATASDPQSNVNTITYTQPRIAYATSSIIAMNTPVAVTGSLTVNGAVSASAFTGSLLGTASFAATASYALNAGITAFTGSFATTGSNHFVGNQAISGSVDVTGSLVVSGNTGINVSSPSARLHISGTIRNDSSTGTPSVGTSGGGSPSQFYGSVGTEYLSTPPTWLKVNIDGTDYFIAAYL